MRIGNFLCPNKFRYARRKLRGPKVEILDIGCGNNSPTFTKRWFPNCGYSGVDVARYNNTDEDVKAMDAFYPVGLDGTGYSAIPDCSFDYIILNHVVEHMENAEPILSTLCSKLRPGGYIWIAFPSHRSLWLPSAKGSLHFCDDDTHVFIPDVREVSNILLRHKVRIVRAGRSHDPIRWLIGAAVLPIALLRRVITGRLSSVGLWYVMGFEDCVLGQRRPVDDLNASINSAFPSHTDGGMEGPRAG